MNFQFTQNAWEDFEYWMDHDPAITGKIRDLMRSIRQDPFKGLGKPEPLRHTLQGYWSRRISGEHRIVYQVSEPKGSSQKCVIIQCRYHYDK